MRSGVLHRIAASAAVWMTAAQMALGQPAPAAQDPFKSQWIAFDAKMAGYHGLTVDVQTIYNAGLLFEPRDDEIVDAQKSVDDLKRAVKLQTDNMVAGKPDAPANLKLAMDMLAEAESRLATLMEARQQMLEQRRAETGDCDTLAREGLKWRKHATDARDEIIASQQFDFFDDDHRRQLEMLESESYERAQYYIVLASECEMARRKRNFEADLAAIPEKIETLKEKAAETKAVARRGRYEDIGALRKTLSEIILAEAQLQKVGHERAGELQAEANDILATYVGAFADTCDQQSVPQDFVLGLERQMQLLGATPATPDGAAGATDLLTCTYRLWEASGDAGNSAALDSRVGLILRNCSADLTGAWKVRDQLKTGEWWTAAGEGSSAGSLGGAGISGTFSMKGDYDKGRGVRSKNGLSFSGEFQIVEEIIEDSEGRVFQRDILMPLSYRLAAHDFQVKSVPFASPFYRNEGGVLVAMSMETPMRVKPIHDEKPCNPSRDVWSY